MPRVTLTAGKLTAAHEALRKVIECPELGEGDVKALADALKRLDMLYVEVGRE